MADSGRLLYKQVKADNRLLAPAINGVTSANEMALKAAVDLLIGRSENQKLKIENQKSDVAIVGSGRSSVEEQFLTKKLADALKVSDLAGQPRRGRGQDPRLRRPQPERPWRTRHRPHFRAPGAAARLPRGRHRRRQGEDRALRRRGPDRRRPHRRAAREGFRHLSRHAQ
jgi:hypothetical protein